MTERRLTREEVRAFYDRFGRKQDLQRLYEGGNRARILQTDGSFSFDLSPESFDRFVSIYVLDLLSTDDMRAVIREAHRLLKGSGLVCLVSITPGKTFFSRLVMSAWMRIYQLRPAFLGGCRPIELMTVLDTDRWKVLYHDIINTFGLSSEVLVAEKITH